MELHLTATECHLPYGITTAAAAANVYSVVATKAKDSVTFHPTQVNTPALTPARQAGTGFACPGGMEG